MFLGRAVSKLAVAFLIGRLIAAPQLAQAGGIIPFGFMPLFSGVTPPSVTWQEIYEGDSGVPSYGTGSWMSGSFTPTAGRRLLAIASAMRDGGTASIATAMTISSNQLITWTPVATINQPSAWAIGSKVWVSSVVEANPTTITLDCGTNPIGIYFLDVIEFTGGALPITNVVSSATAPTDGAYTVTLAQSAVAGDLTVFHRFIDEGPGGLAMSGGGFSVIADSTDTNGYGGFGVAASGSFSGTSISIADTNTAGSTWYKAIDVGLSIQATYMNVQPFDIPTSSDGVCATLTDVTAPIWVGNGSGTVHVTVQYLSGTNGQVYYNFGGSDVLVSDQTGSLTGSFAIDDFDTFYITFLNQFCDGGSARITLRDGNAFGDVLNEFEILTTGI